MNVTPDHITNLAPNEVFVYGSNEAYRHGSGAAKAARAFGAQYGIGPFCGQTYGISTKDCDIKTLDLDDIQIHINHFTEYAETRPELTFLVSAIGCGLAGYMPDDIAPMFAEAARLPNVSLPASFWEVLND